MHDEHGTLRVLACYMHWEPMLCIPCAAFLTTNCKIVQVLIQFCVDTCGYQVCPDSMKYMLLLGNFN